MIEIQVPKPITLLDLVTGRPARELAPGALQGTPLVEAVRTFEQWAYQYLLNDERARGKTIESLSRLVTHLVPAFRMHDVVRLEDADYQRLAPIAREPRAIMAPVFDAQLAPFSILFLAAKERP
jgi:hypothetical protein